MLATLLSVIWIIPALWLAYTLRALWVARREWELFDTDTKAFYLLVAPPITLAMDVFLITDRMFYWPRVSVAGAKQRKLPVKRTLAVIAALALITDAASAAEADASADSLPALKLEEPIANVGDRDSRQPYLSPSEASSIQYRELQSEQTTVDPDKDGNK